MATPFGTRNVALDGLRGVAVLLILIFHTVQVGGSSNVIDVGFGTFRSFMWSGVDLFFVLSGFLITGILIDSRDGPGYFRNFYARRSLRIFPLYYAVVIGVLVAVAVAFAVGVDLPGSARRLLDNAPYLLTYTHNFAQAAGPGQTPGMGHLWSLAIEEQFYLAWPLVVFAVPRRHILKVALGGALFALAFRSGLAVAGVDGWAIRHLTPGRLDPLLLGAAAAIMLRDWDPLLVRRWFGRAASVAGVVLVGITVANGGRLAEVFTLTHTVGFSALAVVYTYAVVAVATGGIPPAVTRVLHNRAFLRMGLLSYGIYVFHFPISRGAAVVVRRLGVDDLLPTRLLDGIVVFAITVAVTLPLAELSWRLYESRWLRLKSRFSYHPSVSQPSEPVPSSIKG